MIEQFDGRTMGGLKGSYRWLSTLLGLDLDTTIGLQIRGDAVANGLHHAPRRQRLSTEVDSDVREGSVAVYGQGAVSWRSWLRSVVGFRADGFGFGVDDHLTGTPQASARAFLLSPKASLILTPGRETDVFLNFGMGFHSNDARGVVAATMPVTPLTRAMGYEVGARTRFLERLDAAGSLFVLDLESEIVWVGDEGTTEARGPTRRLGAELEVRVEVLPWLHADLDLTRTRATFVENAGNANAVALAPTLVASGGLSLRHPQGIFGRLGIVHIGDRAATEDRFFTAQGFTRIDATLGYHGRRFELTLAVQNLLDRDWREAQFANVSRLAAETSAADCPAGTRPMDDGGTFLGCEDMHFTPGAPINAQLSATLFF